MLDRKPDIENITVFSDASFCHKTRAAGGAFWARGDVLKLSDSFSMERVEQSHDAEVMAACEAILRIAKHPEFAPLLALGPKTRIVLVIDCLAIQDALQNKVQRTLGVASKKMVAEVLALKKKLNFWLKVNHVKAHNGTGSPRNWVNDWCDKNSRQKMQEMRDSRKS